MKYKILSHTADIKIQVFGKTKKELFLNAILGMNVILKPEILSNRLGAIKKIGIKSVDINALLVDFLNEVLYLSQVNKEVYEDIRFVKFTSKELKGELIGKKIKFFGEDIKAVTHHGLMIKQGKKRLWQATVLFDI